MEVLPSNMLLQRLHRAVLKRAVIKGATPDTVLFKDSESVLAPWIADCHHCTGSMSRSNMVISFTFCCK
jgi:hypothetical protein